MLIDILHTTVSPCRTTQATSSLMEGTMDQGDKDRDQADTREAGDRRASASHNRDKAVIAVQRRLAGKARPREEVLREHQEFNAKRREHIKESVLWTFLAPDPDKFYRWRVQLDCGCIRGVLTCGDKKTPDQGGCPDPIYGGSLPAGQLLCEHDGDPPAPYRDIIEWKHPKEVPFPADSVDPPDWIEDMPQVWTKIRRDEPHTSASWTVVLSCGHASRAHANLDWKPELGPRRVSDARQQEMALEFEETANLDVDERLREHHRRMITQGWPIPQTETTCGHCPSARRMVAYQRAGWLVPPPKVPKPQSRGNLERRLQRAEAQAAQLREQLTQLDGEEP